MVRLNSRKHQSPSSVIDSKMTHKESLTYVFDTIGLREEACLFLTQHAGITKVRQLLLDSSQLEEWKESRDIKLGDYLILRNFCRWFIEYKKKNNNRAPSNWKVALSQEIFDVYEEIVCHCVTEGVTSSNSSLSDEAPDETGVEIKDIQTVMNQTGCSRKEAAQSLTKNSGDLVNSIMSVPNAQSEMV
jgi:NACalpha-BTF3-like transcription factor